MAKSLAKMSGLKKLQKELKNLTFEIKCPDCGKTISLSQGDIGTHVTCSHCGLDIDVKSG